MKASRFVMVLLVVATVGALAAGCGGQSTEDVVKADKSSAGNTVGLKVGQTLEITLEGNPSTGYEWTVAAPTGTVLEEVGKPEFKAQSTLTGAPGTYLFRFKAKAKGEEELKFQYKRSWETTPQDETVSFKVSVK